MKNNLLQRFGFENYLKGQEEVVNLVLNGNSAAAIFPTGAGKSLCYQLPAIGMPHLTLVVSPLLSLMKDQIDFLAQKNIPAARLDSTLGRDEYNNVLRRAREGEIKILMISVERFKNERFRVQLKNIRISLMVVDEAHCISEWGHNFRPEYLKLPIYREEFKIPNVLLLTATATEEVTDDMCRKFAIPRKNVVITGFFRENLHLKITPTVEIEKNKELLNRLKNHPDEPAIIYVTLQKTAEQVAEMLQANNIPAQGYHAGLENEERETIQNRFMRGEINIIVATIAFGMGIDKRNIRKIIHYDLPKSIENYSQEIGRAGRDGLVSVCEVLANRDKINVLENFIYGDTPEKWGIEKLLKTIKNNPLNDLEIKLNRVGGETDIRLLPLKTLLVYLDIKKIITPKYVYFEDYKFKFISKAEEIIDRFEGERKNFVEELFKCCGTARIWTTVLMDNLTKNNRYPRERVVSALDYFNEKGWIELTTQHAVDVYGIVNTDFPIDQLTKELYQLFKDKEKHELSRLHHMINLFENRACLSRALAEYFGEHLGRNCGHCSSCDGGPAEIKATVSLPRLTEYNFNGLTAEFFEVLKEKASETVTARFLCGIPSPLIARMKAKNISGFGELEHYPFHDVLDWVIQQGE
ncbi:MAG: RecQ family ATP-dependent DNA helicase [Elusimicrobiota bacterium]